MAKKSESPADRTRAPSRRLAEVGIKGRRIVRKLAQGTLLAAGIAATQFTIAEMDPRYPVFSRNLVDRLHEPVSRRHE